MQQFKTEPRAHQHRALELMDGKPAFAIFGDTGTGKCKMTLDDVAREFRRGTIDTLLVIAPNGVQEDWASTGSDGVHEGVARHLPEDIPYRVGVYKSGPIRRRMRDVLETPPGHLRIICMHVEALSSASGANFALAVVKRFKTYVVLDESQRIKRPKSKRTKNVWRLAPYAKFRRILTGSPMTKGWEDLYAQFKFLDIEIIGCHTYTAYKQEYCIEVGPYHQIKGYRNLEDLKRRIAPYVFQVLLEDCTDMPDRTFVKKSVPMGTEQDADYHKLRKEFMVEIKSGAIVHATQAATRFVRLQQIVHGFLPMEDGSVHEYETPRPEIALDLLAGLSGKAVVWARFQHDVDVLHQLFVKEGLSHVLHYGLTPKAKRTEIIHRWKNDPAVQFIIATPQTLGTGRNLLEASHMLFYGNSFNWEHRKQALGRNYRIGQEKPTCVWDLVTPRTIEVRIHANHEVKADSAKMLSDTREMIRWLDIDAEDAA